MGSNKSKNLDSNGNVNNNVIIEEGNSTYDHVVILLSGLLIIKFLELFYVVYKIFHKQMKKKYVARSADT